MTFSIALANISARASDFFVDSMLGNDSSPGTLHAPWRTLARVNSARLGADDTVHLRRGRTWREMLVAKRGGVPSHPLTFTSYGHGDQPVISGSDVVTGWSPWRPPIYRAALGAQPGNVYVDGAPSWGLARACCLPGAQCSASRSCSVAEMRPGSWFFNSRQAALYVWLPDGGSPSARAVEAAVRPAGFYANVSDDQASNIVIRGLRIERTAGYGIYFHSYRGRRGLTGVIIERNTVTQTGTGPIDDHRYYNGIMYLQEPTLDTAPVIAANTISYTGGHGNGINCQGADHALIAANNVSYWNHNGIDVKNSSHVTVTRNVAHDGPNHGAAFYSEHATGIVWMDNTVYRASNGFQAALGSTASLGHNSIHDVGTGIYFGPRAAEIVLSHNLIRSARLFFETDGNGTVRDQDADWEPQAIFRIGRRTLDLGQWRLRGAAGRSPRFSALPVIGSPSVVTRTPAQ
jgi:hypothetical protein